MAASTVKKKKESPPGHKPSNEPVLYKRERNKINSLARALQLEHALYQDDTVMRFSSLSNQVNNTDKKIEDLRLDMQDAIRREFMYLIQKMLSFNNKKVDSSSIMSADYGGRS